MKAAPQLPTDFLVPGGDRLPAPLRRFCEQRAQALAGMTLPTRKTENWKYSSRHLRLAEELALGLPAAPADPPEALPGYWVVLENGRPDMANAHLPTGEGLDIRAFSQLDEVEAQRVATRLDETLDADKVQLARINGARLEDGLLVRIGAGLRIDLPLFLICRTDGRRSGSSFPRILVEMGHSSELTLVEEHSSETEAAVFENTVTELDLADSARATYIRLVPAAENLHHLGATGARLGAHARLDSHCLGLGGPLRRHDLQVRLAEPGAECRLNGITLTRNEQHFDNHTVIEHVAPHCTSEETYRCIAADESHAVFNGRILIHRHAQQSAAEMNNKNLLLSNSAEIDTKPELEIYADDVKCAHGATVGQLDADALFYLVSRGIDRREAGALLSMAFVNELVDQVPVEAVRDQLKGRLSGFFTGTFEEV